MEGAAQKALETSGSRHRAQRNTRPGVVVALLVLATALPSFSSTESTRSEGRKYSTLERLRIDRLESVRRDRESLGARRTRVALQTGFNDYRGALHVHADDSPHTGGTLAELIQDAVAAGVSFLMLSDHVTPDRDFFTEDRRGMRNGVLLIPGAEMEGFLVYPATSIRDRKWSSREELVRLVRDGGGDIFLSHVEERLDWPTSGLTGLEIYNHHTDIKHEDEFNSWFRASLTNPERLKEIERALQEYPEEVFGAFQDYLPEIIQKWDADLQLHRLTGIAANDCHHNQVFTLTVADEDSVELSYITSRPTKLKITSRQAPVVSEVIRGRRPGEVIAHLDFDPYERSLKYVSTHVLAGELTERSIREALRSGRAYVAHDWLCDPTGFAFIATDLTGNRIGVLGDEVGFQAGLALRVETPVSCRLKLSRNGSVVLEKVSRRLDFTVAAPGVYRVEAWLDVDGELRPWIYSNPIYVRESPAVSPGRR